MGKVAVVTDSTAYIPNDLVAKLKISVVPLVVIWGNESLEDGVDILPEQFYNRLKTAKEIPTTSQASVPNMHKAFSSLIEQGYDVLGIFISGKLSGTMQSAVQGQNELTSGKEKVTLVDSNTVAMALGFHAIAAAEAAADGASVQDCKKIAEEAQKNSGVYFVVDTLEFLHRGGRIGGAQRFLGSALNIKPILTIAEGKIEAAGSVRTKAKAMSHVVELVQEQCKGKEKVRLATLHANAEADAKEVLLQAGKGLNLFESVLSEVSPAIGTHTGPGTVGLAYMHSM
jgi:fatty acid kinase fatty acid binding subunit